MRITPIAPDQHPAFEVAVDHPGPRDACPIVEAQPFRTLAGGMHRPRFVAPLVLDGPINGEAFLAWTEQFLAPQLRPGDIVIADRLGSHKGAAAREVIEARGAELMLLPPYSHDLIPNPPHEDSRGGFPDAGVI